MESSSKQAQTDQPEAVVTGDAGTACTETSQADGVDKQQTVDEETPVEEKVDTVDGDNSKSLDTDENAAADSEVADESAAAKSAYSFCGYSLALN